MFVSRLITIASITLFIAGTFASEYHATTELHVVCAEHGHTVHAADHSDDEPSEETSFNQAAHDDHHACGFEALSSTFAKADFTLPLAQPTHETLIKFSGQDRDGHLLHAELVNAPKTSPPLFA